MRRRTAWEWMELYNYIDKRETFVFTLWWIPSKARRLEYWSRLKKHCAKRMQSTERV